MLAFVGSGGMPMARTCGKAGNARSTGAAILAFVSGFIIAFVECVLAFVGAERMTMTGACREAGHSRSFGSAVFAVWHSV